MLLTLVEMIKMCSDKKELEFQAPAYDGGYKKPRYFKIEMLVEIPFEDKNCPSLNHLNWSSGCDETFAMLSFVPDDSDCHLLNYQEVSEEFYNKHRFDIIDEEGGL